LSASDALSQAAPGLVATQQAAQDATQYRSGQGCPACQAELVPGAVFCVECGHALGCPCPQCGAEVGGCEFCESCGMWLKPGQCRFCYAATIEGAEYCTECGNSQHGMRCVRCDSVGFFDFCGRCGDPVTELAQALMAAPDDPLLADTLAALRTLDEADRQAADRLTALQAETASQPAPFAAPAVARPRPELNLSGALRSMRSFAAQDAAAAEKARQQAALDRQAERAREAQAAALVEQTAQVQMSQAARQQEMAQSEAGALAREIERQEAKAKLKRLLEQLNQRSYANAQLARSQIMALSKRMAQYGIVNRGWRCNAFGNTHGCPTECSAPASGGIWLFEAAD
jgi:hypothetical protein